MSGLQVEININPVEGLKRQCHRRRGAFGDEVEININPVEGLKHDFVVTYVSGHMVEININPVEGLKQRAMPCND